MLHYARELILPMIIMKDFLILKNNLIYCEIIQKNLYMHVFSIYLHVCLYQCSQYRLTFFLFFISHCL